MIILGFSSVTDQVLSACVSLHQATRRVGPSWRSLKLKKVILFEPLRTMEGVLRVLPSVML